MASATRPADILSGVLGCDASALGDLKALAQAAEEQELRRGDVLVRQGEPADALYFVLSGRFSVHIRGVTEPIAEIGQGEPVGEMGFFAGLPRAATVVALRDSHVLAITREQFLEFSTACPRIMDTVVSSPADFPEASKLRAELRQAYVRLQFYGQAALPHCKTLSIGSEAHAMAAVAQPSSHMRRYLRACRVARSITRRSRTG